MPTYLLSPGAWLNPKDPPRSGNAAFNPKDPPRFAGFNPKDPPRSGTSPFNPKDPPRSGNAPFNPKDPPGGQGTEGDAMPSPWEGIDPAWVYEGGAQALLAQALRKVQSKIVKATDPRLPAIGRNVKGAPPALWRWQSEFRIKALVCELLGYCVVRGNTVWHLDIAAARGKLICTPTEVISITGPATGFDYSDQIDKTLRAAVEREDRLPEILSQANDFTAFFDSITGLDTLEAPITREVLVTAWDVATHLVMRLKHELAEQRPAVRSSLICPVIATPGHGSLPSGHATIAALMSGLLSDLLVYEATHPRRFQLDALARRIAFNRVVAGVHFQMDSAAG